MKPYSWKGCQQYKQSTRVQWGHSFYLKKWKPKSQLRWLTRNCLHRLIKGEVAIKERWTVFRRESGLWGFPKVTTGFLQAAEKKVDEEESTSQAEHRALTLRLGCAGGASRCLTWNTRRVVLVRKDWGSCPQSKPRSTTLKSDCQEAGVWFCVWYLLLVWRQLFL